MEQDSAAVAAALALGIEPHRARGEAARWRRVERLARELSGTIAALLDAPGSPPPGRLAPLVAVGAPAREEVARASIDAHGAVPPASASCVATDTLDVYLLGPFKAFRDDRLVADWPPGRPRALFKYLAAHADRPVAKEVLMDVFWPEARIGAARNSLNVALHALRRALAPTASGEPAIVFADGCYRFHPRLRVWVDAAEFRVRHEEGLRLEQHGELDAAMHAYRAAALLYAQPFLVEDRYEPWVDAVRRPLEQACAHLLERLSHYEFERGCYEGCIEAARRLVALDPCHEEAHRLLMRSHARLGQQHLALRQYHAGAAALGLGLNVAPSAETVELGARIRARLPV